MQDHSMIAVSRRRFLLGSGGAALAVAGIAGALPRAATAAETDAAAAIQKLIGDAKPQAGKVAIKLPQIAENGNTVPFTVVVDSPMTESNYVKAIHVLADGNPSPGVASYYFTPAAGKAEVASRMRLAKTQNIKALAVMSDGSVYANQQEVKVTIGGCGG